MNSVLSRYATPFISGLFLVSLVSGVALFFNVGQSSFHEMHEILSMVLIVPFVLHVWKNWRSIVNYLKRAPMWIGLAVSLAIAVPFAIPSSGSEGRSGPPQFALAAKMMQGSVNAVAPILGTDADGLSARLAAAGFTVTSPDQSLAAVAQASGKDVMALQAVLVAAPSAQ